MPAVPSRSNASLIGRSLDLTVVSHCFCGACDLADGFPDGKEAYRSASSGNGEQLQFYKSRWVLPILLASDESFPGAHVGVQGKVSLIRYLALCFMLESCTLFQRRSSLGKYSEETLTSIGTALILVLDSACGVSGNNLEEDRISIANFLAAPLPMGK